VKKCHCDLEPFTFCHSEHSEESHTAQVNSVKGQQSQRGGYKMLPVVSIVGKSGAGKTGISSGHCKAQSRWYGDRQA